jgi:hypothetical protein
MIQVLRSDPKEDAGMGAEYIAAPVMFPKPDLGGNMTPNHQPACHAIFGSAGPIIAMRNTTRNISHHRTTLYRGDLNQSKESIFCAYDDTKWLSATTQG